MKITINISKKEMKHLASPHTFYNECEIACIQFHKEKSKLIRCKSYSKSIRK